jgi:hypothetical protein
MINYITELTVIIVGLLLFFTVKNFLPSYFNEKAKNLATKEDVGAITEKVEKIKSEFVKDIEFIKADLSYINQNKFSIKTVERDALIEINNKYSEWLNLLLNVSFSNVNPSNYETLNNYYNDIKIKKLNFDIAQDNLHLFLHDDELMKVKVDCVTETSKLEFIVVKAIVDIIQHFYLDNIYFQSISTLDEKQKPKEDWLKQQMASSKKELDVIFYKFIQDKSEQFSIVHQRRVIFVTALKARLYNIMT